MENNAGLARTPQGTFMEETTKSTMLCSDGLCRVDGRLLGILIKMRGNIPSPEKLSETKQPPEESYTSKIKYQLQLLSEFLNSVHNHLDELEKLI